MQQQIAPTTPVAGLATARKVQNLSIDDAARQLKLSVNQVRALEAGEFQKLPGPVFVRGFLRNYSRLLGLDPEEVLRSVAPELPALSSGSELPPSKEIPFPAARSGRRSGYALAALILAGLVIAYGWYVDEPLVRIMKTGTLTHLSKAAPASPKPRPPPPAVSAEKIQVVDKSTPPAQGGSTVVQDSDAATIAAPAAVPPETPVLEETPVSPAVETAPTPDARAPPATIEREVRLSFDKASWVEIRDRFGKIIFSQLNMPGTERSLHGQPPLSLVIGNAHAVHVTYDDNPVDLQKYTKVDVARLTLE